MNEMDLYLFCLLGLGFIGVVCGVVELILSIKELW